MKPNFKNITIKSSVKSVLKGSEWDKENNVVKDWITPEQIALKSVYNEDDLENMEHLNYAAGIPPFLRGPYSTMYVMRPWTIRNMPVFRLLKSPMHFTDVTWQQDKRGSRLLSIWLLTGDTTQIMNVLSETLEKLA